MSNYFYSGQIRRFLQQFIRLLTNFQIQLGADRTGQRTLLQVPIYYGDSSRQVASILQKNSENNLNTVPAMAVYISALKYDRPRLQEPHHVSKMQLRERAYAPDTGQYTSYQGDTLTIERIMPVPYLLSLKVDIWCSNTDQKLQLIEQIGVIFNPSLEIQSTDSYVDWTSLSYVTLTDVNFSSKSIPVGPEDPIDVATLSFDIPIWLSAPAKVKKQGVIQKILASVYENSDLGNDYFDIQGSVLATRKIYTPVDYNIVYFDNLLKIYVNNNEIEFSDQVVPAMVEASWPIAIQSFGELAGVGGSELLVNGLSQIRLTNDGVTVVGTVAYHPTDDSLLIFNADIDTLPVNTLTAIAAIIDPLNVTVDSALLTPTLGTRYLILEDIGHPDNNDTDPSTVDGAPVWNRAGRPQLIARANDIIEWTGTHWIVSFDSAIEINVQYVTNLTTGIQYKWKNNQWSKSVQGRYGVGAWSFVPNN